MKIRPRVCHAVLSVAVAVGLSACSSPADREAKALRRGNEYLQAGNVDKARIEYRNALQLVPNDPEARYRNGLVSEKRGDYREAAQYYMGAIEVDPKRDVARRALVRLLVAGHAPNEALDAIEAGLDQMPGDAGYLAFRAVAKTQLDDRAGAVADAELAFKTKPADEYVASIYAGLLVSEGKKSDARDVLEKAAKLLPDAVDLRLALANLESDGNPARSEFWLRQAIEMRPKVAAYRVSLAQFLARSGQVDAAEKEIRTARRLFPEDADARDGLVRFLIGNRGTAAAEAELRAEADQHPEDDGKRLLLSAFLMQSGAPDRAEVELKRVVQHAGTNASGLSARARLASLALARGDTAAAEKGANEVLERSPRDPEALLVRGNVKLQREDARGAVDDLRTASRDAPNSVPLLVALGRAHAAAGDAGLAEESLRRAAELSSGDPLPAHQLAMFLLGQGRAKDARAVMLTAFRAAANDPAIAETTLRAALGSKDHALAEEVIARTRAIPGDAARAEFYAGLTAVAEGHRDEALKHYLDSVHRDPAAPVAVGEAVKLLIGANRRADAMRLLDEVSAKVPNSGASEVLRGDLLLSARDLPAAEAAFREALKRQPRMAGAQRGLAYAVLGRGDLEGAIKSLTNAAAESDNPGYLHGTAGQLLELAGRFGPARERYEDALRIHPGDAGLRAKVAVLLLLERDDAATRKRAGELINGFAESPAPRLRDAYAWVGLKSGDAPGALRLLEQLGHDAPADALIQYHLGVARNEAGDRPGAVKALTIAVAATQRFPGDMDARTLLAKLSTNK